MNFKDKYLKRFKAEKSFVSAETPENLEVIVVIPIFDEDKIIDTVKCLFNCKLPDCNIEIIAVINSGEHANQEQLIRNITTYNLLNEFKANNNAQIKLHTIFIKDIEQKKAGAGYARKIGMDEAIHRFGKINKPNGIIINIDADCLCEENYFVEIYNKFKYEKINLATIYFEHEISGDNFSQQHYQSIILYELYLRYYKHVISYINFPYSVYTVGSCFAVDAKTYTLQGGMNTKKAGEDFYFIHKVIPHYRHAEINTTCVYPSSRISKRVPFGTGVVVEKILQGEYVDYQVFNLNSFLELKLFFDCHNKYFKNSDFTQELPEALSNFLDKINYKEKITEINNNCISEKIFAKKFFTWFNGLNIIKFLNFANENYYNKQPILAQAQKFLSMKYNENFSNYSAKELLIKYRIIDKSIL